MKLSELSEVAEPIRALRKRRDECCDPAEAAKLSVILEQQTENFKDCFCEAIVQEAERRKIALKDKAKLLADAYLDKDKDMDTILEESQKLDMDVNFIYALQKLSEDDLAYMHFLFSCELLIQSLLQMGLDLPFSDFTPLYSSLEKLGDKVKVGVDLILDTIALMTKWGTSQA